LRGEKSLKFLMVMVLALGAGLATAIFAPPQVAAGQPADWRVLSVTNAEIRLPGGGWQPMDGNTLLVAGAEIRVAAAGRAVLESEGDQLTLSPNSRMKLPAGAEARDQSVLQSVGTIVYKIRKRARQLLQGVSTGAQPLAPGETPFKVGTPYLAAVIKGTTFSVNVSAQGAALHVTEGLVEAISASTGERGLVRPGQTARVGSLPGAALSISHGGQTRGRPAGTQAAGDEAKAGDDGAAKAQGAAKGQSAQAPGKGLKVAVGSGRVDVAKSSKGLLRAKGAGSSVASNSRNVPGKKTVKIGGKPVTPGQLTAGLGNVAIPGLLPNGKTFPGGGNGNGNGNSGGSNGSNGCNGNGKKPGC
jgi:hypothetical protein